LYKEKKFTHDLVRCRENNQRIIISYYQIWAKCANILYCAKQRFDWL